MKANEKVAKANQKLSQEAKEQHAS